jgi:hypothetical protein
MNTVGWGGGALGRLRLGGFPSTEGGATQMENMSHAISFCSIIYLVEPAPDSGGVSLSAELQLLGRQLCYLTTGNSPMRYTI